MQQIHVPAKQILGIALRTTNENNQSALDIPRLWQEFHAQNMIHQIPAKINTTIYVIYTDYERDHTAPYTTLIGCEVQNLAVIPPGLVGHRIPAGTYTQLTVEGNLMDNLVIDAWVRIWNSPNLERTYTSDFEVYGPEAQDPTQAKVALYLATK